MATLIKICGITRLEDARYASAVGADYIGFIQKPGDIREADSSTAREIIDWVVGPKPVGVFENRSAEEVLASCSDVGFTHAQLDGHESPDDTEAIQAGGIGVIKSFRVKHDASSEQLRSLFLTYTGAADYLRLDVSETSLLGGDGESLSWRLIRELSSEFKLFLSGNVTPTNVEHIVSAMRPFAVDASESVEEVPGVKDFGKLGDLFDVWHTLTPETI